MSFVELFFSFLFFNLFIPLAKLLIMIFHENLDFSCLPFENLVLHNNMLYVKAPHFYLDGPFSTICSLIFLFFSR